MIWSTPVELTESVINVAKKLNGVWVGFIKVQPELWAKDYCCHWNVKTKCKADGGKIVNGWYLLYWDDPDVWQAISHSVYMNNEGILIDITPNPSGLNYQVFVQTLKKSNNNNLFIRSVSPANYKEQETKIMYYVYMLVDPRTDIPFYIGKGKGRRAKNHLWEIPDTRNSYKENKIASIRESGLEPKIIYVAENIIDESLANEMEIALIRKYKGKDYETI